ncbi:ABC-type glutathione transport system ATPase component [Mycobacterium frederiksbergense]|uniref:ABC-type glutathione transport system ATPase component n=1 Tax=Mycolicibacterium frederiksbergense TaxID=117567 RepID=A0ABT6L5G7_9MYCO|nr:ATP-binding cassette domain-containing protein [Mycolicibacterium frederiksbergense]MDH6198180.1 ABC-type glutathione transport system ATPase component [Mycolicibacterium frederiksbergense]
MTIEPPIVEIKSVSKRFGNVAVLDDVSLTVERGKTTSLVGESGSGKSTLARVVTGLEKPDTGTVLFSGHVRPRRGKAARDLQHRVGVVLQDPYDSIDSRFTIGEVVAEPLRAQRRYRQGGREKVRELLDLCGMTDVDLDSRITGFSGGQRQRVAIARALASDPALIVCDEPTSALDVSVQAQILNLLLRLQRERGLAYLFITHDIDVVRRISDQVAVMHRGQIVEMGETAAVTGEPQHPYTQKLLGAVLGSSPHTRKLSGPLAKARDLEASSQ